MKSSLIRPALALALAAGLAGCGGSDKAEFTVKGTITGIVYEGAVLSTNGMDLAITPPATPGGTVSFAFPNKLEYGDVYNVQFTKTPNNQSRCGTPTNVIPNYTDTAGRLAEINITLQCAVDEYTVGGTVTGLTGSGLTVANGSTGNNGAIALPTTPTTEPIPYTLPVAVPYGTSYSVAVITQPAGQVCTVANATGEMRAANVSNVNITCVAAPN